MSDYPPFIKRIIFLIFGLFISNLLFSCADSTPELAGNRVFMIFEYSDMNSKPLMKLAPFVHTVSDGRRAEKISIYNKKNHLEWVSDNPVVFGDEKNQWVGYLDFVCSANKKMPLGFYDFYYEDGEGRVLQTAFSLAYDEKLADSSAKDFLKNTTVQKKEKIALYSEQNLLLYYGERKSSWKEDSDIFKIDGRSSYYKTCYVLTSENSVYIMPPVYKNADKSDNNK